MRPCAAAREDLRPLYPRGPWLRLELCCLDPSSRTMTPSVSPTGTLRLHGLAAYTQRLRCAGAPRRPAGPSLLLRPCLPCMSSTLPRRARRALPLYSHGDSKLPLTITESPPARPVSASNVRRGISFRGCIVRFMLRPARLPSPPDWLRRDEVTCASPRLLRCIVTPASGAARYRTALGVRLDGRTGNLPSSGLAPDKSQQLVRLHDSATPIVESLCSPRP